MTSNIALSGKANEDPIQTRDKRDVLEAFWPVRTTPILAVKDDRDRCPWDAYFRHYTAECRKFIEPDGGAYITVREHRDIIAIVRKLEEGGTKETIKRSLASLVTQQRREEDKYHMAEGAIRLVARLFLMIDVGAPSKYQKWGSSFLPWSDEQDDVKTVLADYFVVSSAETGNVVFEEEFTAFNIQRFTGLKIQWTSNLADHLRLIDNERRICIFHHATFLQHQNRHVLKYDLCFYC